MTIKPVSNNVYVELIEIEAKQKSTIIIMPSTTKEQFRILDIGEGVKVNMKKGQKVFLKSDAEMVKVEDKKFIVKDSDILAIYV